jgi:hypothetical protein
LLLFEAAQPRAEGLIFGEIVTAIGLGLSWKNVFLKGFVPY